LELLSVKDSGIEKIPMSPEVKKVQILEAMNSPRSKLRGITSASLRYADNMEKFFFGAIPVASYGEFQVKAYRP
jgi:hypothetical protein